MNFTATFCFYVMLPYFTSLMSPPQKTITCYAAEISVNWLKRTTDQLMNKMRCLHTKTADVSSNNSPVSAIALSEELPVDVSLFIPKLPLDDQYFNQNRDHYHFNDSSKWQQRYLVYGEHYNGNGILFIRIGTDQDITAWNMQNGRWYEYCKEANALCVGIELRGYGKSLPNGNLRDENLKYLNSQQALADVAWFMYNFRSLQTGYKLPEKLKWVAHGTSKQGTLATWLRLKFPHLVLATFSLSSPVLAKEEYNDYFKLIESKMLDKEQNFKDAIRKAYNEIKYELESNKFEELGELFKFCDKNSLGDKENGQKNKEFMYFIFAHTMGTIMQYGNDDMLLIKKRANKIMLDTSERYKNLGSPIKRFALLITMMLQKYNKECLQMNYHVAINGYKITTESEYKSLDYLLPKIFGNRTTLYQSCNEFGQFETFVKFFDTSIGLRFYTDFCRAVFGERYSKQILEKGVRRTNVFYGGLNIAVTRVVFVYGVYDPYIKLGVIDYVPRKTVTRYLIGARHCYELDYANSFPGFSILKQSIFDELIDSLQLTVRDVNNENDNKKLVDTVGSENYHKTDDGQNGETV